MKLDCVFTYFFMFQKSFKISPKFHGEFFIFSFQIIYLCFLTYESIFHISTPFIKQNTNIKILFTFFPHWRRLPLLLFRQLRWGLELKFTFKLIKKGRIIKLFKDLNYFINNWEEVLVTSFKHKESKDKENLTIRVIRKNINNNNKNITEMKAHLLRYFQSLINKRKFNLIIV